MGQRAQHRLPGVLPALALAVALALSGAGVAFAQGNAATDESPATEPVAVRWQPAGEVFIHPRREAAASVLARNESQLAAELSAVIASVAVDVGEQVSAGQELARLDPVDFELNVSQARAQRDGLRARLNLAQDQLRKARELKTNNFVSSDAVNQRAAEVVSLRAELNGADAQLAIAERRLAKAVIRAPYDAVILGRQAQLGELTAPGSALFTLVEVGAEELAVQMPAAAARTLDTHPPTRYVFVGGGREVEVRLLRLSPVITRASRTREARFSFIGPALPAGTEGQLQWSDARPHLPATTLVRRDGSLGVFVVEDGRAGFVAMAQAQEGRPAATTLSADAPLITQGQERLQQGQKIVAQPASPTARD